MKKSIGARVIVSDVRQERLDAAAAIGVPESDIVPVGKSVQEFVEENDLSNQIDATVDFVGLSQTFEDAQQIGEVSRRSCLLDHADTILQFGEADGWFALALYLRKTWSI